MVLTRQFWLDLTLCEAALQACYNQGATLTGSGQVVKHSRGSSSSSPSHLGLSAQGCLFDISEVAEAVTATTSTPFPGGALQINRRSISSVPRAAHAARAVEVGVSGCWLPWLRDSARGEEGPCHMARAESTAISGARSIGHGLRRMTSCGCLARHAAALAAPHGNPWPRRMARAERGTLHGPLRAGTVLHASNHKVRLCLTGVRTELMSREGLCGPHLVPVPLSLSPRLALHAPPRPPDAGSTCSPPACLHACRSCARACCPVSQSTSRDG
jgi:hypothetical protein